MMKDSERYILTTEKASVIRDVLSLVFAAVKAEGAATPDASPSLETFAESGCDRMILELLRPKEAPEGVLPMVRNLRISRLGRVLIVTGKATGPEILQDIEAIRRPHFFPELLTSGLTAPVRSLFHTLRLSNPQN